MADTKSWAIPEFAATALDEIPQIADTLRTTFHSQKTKDVQFRLKQLRKLYWSLVDNVALIEEALYKDLHLCKHEANLVEIDVLLGELDYAIRNVEKWAKDESVPGMPLMFWAMRHRVRKEPLGTVLIIGPYNFPFQLNVLALFGAIAAGCTAVVKPSESAPASAMVLQKMLETCLDPAAYRVINGAVEESKALLEEKWDKIFYTGGSEVGKIVAMQAAKTLTPVSLELGGMNPAFITRNANLRIAARRLMWAKTMVAGQLCLSQNYCLVDESVVDEFIQELMFSNKDMFPNGAKESPDYARIVNKRQFVRIKNMVDESRGRIVLGGHMDESDLYIEPTVVLVESPDDALIRGETFGPVFSIVPYKRLEDAIKVANDVYGTPLALYIFGSKAESKYSVCPPIARRGMFAPLLTPYSLGQYPVWRRHHQRHSHPFRHHACTHERRRHVGPRKLPRQGILRRLHPPPRHGQQPIVGRQVPAGEVHAVCLEASAAPAGAAAAQGAWIR
jgi:beta-apo-4'-carotenal oxygenase